MRHLGLVFLNNNRLQVVNDLRPYCNVYYNILKAIGFQNEFDLVASADVINVFFESDDFMFFIRTVNHIGYNRY
jgi:hypothetical protein